MHRNKLFIFISFLKFKKMLLQIQEEFLPPVCLSFRNNWFEEQEIPPLPVSKTIISKSTITSFFTPTKRANNPTASKHPIASPKGTIKSYFSPIKRSLVNEFESEIEKN